MSALAAINSATVSTQQQLNQSQQLMNQSQLRQARQAADQAEATAKDLRIKADQAELESVQWQRQAQKLSTQLLQQAQNNSTPPSPSTVYSASSRIKLYNSNNNQSISPGSVLSATA